MEDVLVPIIVIPAIFIGMPWIILHYITKWKQAPRITAEDEGMLDEMFNLARRLEDRVNTVERIVAADSPDWQPRIDAPQASYEKPSYDKPTYQIDRRM